MRNAQLDHLVLPTASLAVARERLTALGFTVAPDGHHPFGTSNCCIYFADGTFIEPLAITDRDAADKAVEAQNVFVARDRLFRSTVGEEGLSAIVLASEDARADHEEFRRARISTGPMLEFSRPFVDASGARDEASFRLAFAEDSQARGCYFFTCQRVRAPQVDRSALQRHPNGVIRPRMTYWAAEEMPEKMRFWRDFLGMPPIEAEPDHLLFVTQRGWHWIATDEYLWTKFGIEPDYRAVGMRGRAIEFECEDVDRVRLLLDAAAIDHQVKHRNIIVPPAPGQGVAFIFGNPS